ncbi:hypothetical protein BD560DRAFT_319194, partial [Blakeslea trispora]
IVVQEPTIRVTSGQTITLEAKGTDTSIRINFLVSNNNYAMMYYFLRFFKMRTAHRVLILIITNVFDLQKGSLNVSAYTFDFATRAFAFVRVGVQSIAPFREVGFQGNISDFGQEHGCFPVNEENAPPNSKYSKLKFILFRYVWENWSNETLIKRRETLREPFTDYLDGLYDDL